MGDYQKAYDESIKNPESFWTRAAQDVVWSKKYTKVLDDSGKPFYRWFIDGELNTCYNALDFHIEQGRGSQTAIIYDSPVTGKIEKITYKELKDQVALFAGALKNNGIAKGDRVIIYMPMITVSPKGTASSSICR